MNSRFSSFLPWVSHVLIILLIPVGIIAQPAPKDTLKLDLTDAGLILSLSGDLNQSNTLPFSQFKTMQQQSKAPFINMGFADHMRYSIHLSNGTDTLHFNQWELPQALVWLHYQEDRIGLFVNAFKNPKISFSEEYKARHDGKIRIMNSPVFELVNTLLYLSDYGENEQLPFPENAYSNKVKTHFAAHQKHPAITRLNAWFANNPSRDAQNQLYYTLRMDALGYEWNNGSLNARPHLQYLGGKNGLQGLLKDIKDFAQQSGFFKFYEQQQDIYKNAQKQFESMVNAAAVKSWLDQHSDQQFNALSTVLVTLSNGLHNTRKFSNNGFTELYMIISAPTEVKSNSIETQASLTRQLFTELDHHYVNPEGMARKTDIKKAMSQPDLWYDAAQWGGYNSALSIFLEYMTWSLFSAYAVDHFPAASMESIRQKHVAFMVEKRHFVRFKAFEEATLAFHRAKNGNYQIKDLVAHMIEWTAKNR